MQVQAQYNDCTRVVSICKSMCDYVQVCESIKLCIRMCEICESMCDYVQVRVYKCIYKDV
jgi:hypothetical protein